MMILAARATTRLHRAPPGTLLPRARTLSSARRPRAPIIRAASGGSSMAVADSKNVLGGELELCCSSPRTGFYRDGFCCTGPEDMGVHTVCAQVTAEFLEFSRSRGNDLSTPRPEFSFPGLKPGDRWCLCASRWEEARLAGCAPPVFLRACHENTLAAVEGGIDELMKFSLPTME